MRSTPADPLASSAPARRSRPVIAIDGPAGAGKSTLAAHLARRFGLLNLETGAMYRALALKAIERDMDFDDEAPLLALAENTSIVLTPQREGNCVFLDRLDVSRRIRDPDVSAGRLARLRAPAAAGVMVTQQRALGKDGGVVMEGRDIGTCVFPDAEVKIFLDADPAVRGSRRFQQVMPSVNADGNTVRPQTAAPITEESVLRELKERDTRDRNRAESPLRPAPDAVVVDSTELTLEQVIARAEEIVRSHLPD